MLSYLHGFHVGNHADVLKHTVLVSALTRLVGKPKPLRYIETHAGGGAYDLRSPAAQRNREYASGIGRVFAAADAPDAVRRLVDLVRAFNGGGELHRYPGSPTLARTVLRPDDRLCLFELHPAEHEALLRTVAGDRRVKVLREDGLAGCIGLVPPPERRVLVLIDPSYELKNEHEQVVDAVTKAHRRFATGVYAVWYPVIDRWWVDRFERAMRASIHAPMTLFELCIARDSRARGLTGSGIIVINPPWTLEDEMRSALPWLARAMGHDEGTYRLVKTEVD